MSNVLIVDYELGNVASVARAIEECGGLACVSNRSDDFEWATHIVLPGVGSFADGMRQIRARGLDRLLHRHVMERKVPLLGVCLGMQLLATLGHEGETCAGLGFIPGEVVRLVPPTPATRIPHIGWNEVRYERPVLLFDQIPSGRDFYFVHSYYFEPQDSTAILAQTPYCGDFASAVGQNNVFGVQFHPEKSLRTGHQLLRNFLAL